VTKQKLETQFPYTRLQKVKQLSKKKSKINKSLYLFSRNQNPVNYWFWSILFVICLVMMLIHPLWHSISHRTLSKLN